MNARRKIPTTAAPPTAMPAIAPVLRLEPPAAGAAEAEELAVDVVVGAAEEAVER
jgi:hypothetical protein